MTDHKQTLPLPCEAADKLIAAHDGDMALVYLQALRAGALDAEAAARALCRTAREIDAAAEKLRRMGLLGAARDGAETEADDPERLLPPADAMPEYSAEDLTRFSKEEPLLQTIYGEAAQVFGRKLSAADMRMLAGVYRHLGLPPEVILVLLHYCAESAAERRAGSVPSPRSVEKEAYDWANREILTLEQAEEYIRFRRERRGLTAQVKEVLNIRGRELTKTEAAHVAEWLDLGFTPEVVAIAYDRTVTNTGSLRWPYMSKILRSWHEKKLHSPQEIEAQEGRRRSGCATGAGARVTAADYVFPDEI